MHAVAIVAGFLLLLLVLLDAFQTIILPRRPVGRFRLTRQFHLLTWYPWIAMARLLPRRPREQMYSFYGPLSLLVLFILWAGLLTAAYTLMYFGLKMPFSDPSHPVTWFQQLRSCWYVSGTTIFTLGLGDVQPLSHASRALIVFEAGTGLGFVALVIGYVPVLYTAFSNREVLVALLDARAGSPPSAGEMLLRHSFEGGHAELVLLLAEWERWAAGMLETMISYPILCYYRSQHDNQSWLSALTAVLDACALLITTVEGESTRQAQLTFAMGRHVLVDLGHVFRLEAREQQIRENPPDRLPDGQFGNLCEALSTAGMAICSSADTRTRLVAIRALYEPHATALAEYLKLDLPQWMPPADRGLKRDGWSLVAGLRTPAAAAGNLKIHVSPRSVASRLYEDESHLR